MESITDLSELNFNVNSITFSKPKAGASGGKSVNIYFNQGLFRVALPELIQWGAADFKDEKTGKGNDKFDFTIQFPTEDYKTPEATVALKNLQAIEAKLLEAGQQNSKAWFGKMYPAEVLNALWSPMLKYPKNKSTGEPDLSGAPGFRVKLPKWEGEWKSEIYNEDSEKLFPNPENSEVTPVDFLTKGVKATCLIQCGGLWFANGKFGVTWKLLQAVVPKPKESLVGTCFLKKKPSATTSASVSVPVPTQIPVNAVQSEFVEDSDEEDAAEPAATTEQEEQGEDQEDQEEEVAVPVVAAPAPAPATLVLPQAPEEDKKKKATKKK